MFTSVTTTDTEPTTLMSNGELKPGYYRITYLDRAHIVYVLDVQGKRVAIALDDPELYWSEPFKLSVVKPIQTLKLIAD
mgnify:FL=1